MKSLKERGYSEDLGVDGMIILKRISEKQGRMWTRFSRLKIRANVGLS